MSPAWKSEHAAHAHVISLASDKLAGDLKRLKDAAAEDESEGGKRGKRDGPQTGKDEEEMETDEGTEDVEDGKEGKKATKGDEAM